ncbi:MAG: Thioredoxin C-1 [Alphaproteobacteria bacterium MarineAlpha5_Bin11]|nr:thioredoxin [Pelagibacteraceae bacterium]PPR44249.1 MAG: Thioredoxin C-1 [Alphaproteobacteria bacterium MarineAlpha5_Bin11]PPR51861.1 MAG: Thioredoxin C-1 [Alphaproteobacteria bacterium MarineAlpha5_Bin10]|tara:strand:+ start:255 stop:1148 length:894 start_codon:yes stop_codon:yes gene_type:complete
MEIIKDNKSAKPLDIGQDQFITEVIEASKEKVIVVDFWAPWCGPCKDLGPRIEKVVEMASNKVKLVKINIDENKELAGQLQIQSIPTVFAFKDGKIANAFQGALGEKEIVEFIEKIIGEKLEGNISEIIKESRKFLNDEKYEESLNLIKEFLASDKQNNEIIEIYIKNKIALKEFEEVEEIINSLDDSFKNDKNIKSAINSYEITKNADQNFTEEEIFAALKKDPLSLETNKQLSDLYFGRKNYDKAFEMIIDLYIKTSSKNKEKVKKILFDYFEILGNEHESTKIARRKLSSTIFS